MPGALQRGEQQSHAQDAEDFRGQSGVENRFWRYFEEDDRWNSNSKEDRLPVALEKMLEILKVPMANRGGPLARGDAIRLMVKITGGKSRMIQRKRRAFILPIRTKDHYLVSIPAGYICGLKSET